MAKNQEVSIRSINISEKKGTIKKPVESGVVTGEGIRGDAHSGPWHRQISLISVESLKNFEPIAGRKIDFGEFAENLTIEGIDLTKVDLLDRFRGEEVELEVTQIGKKCHGDNCAIFREVGKCAMPKEGIFCRVLKTGNIREGDKLHYVPKAFRALVVTLSDRASRGEYEDKSGKLIHQKLEALLKDKFNNYHIENTVIPDSPKELINAFEEAKNNNMDLLITTGGTGIGSRDITPETLSPLIHKELPGIMEMIRVKFGAQNSNALLSRSIAGVSGKMMVYALPGSSKAVKEYLEIILPTIQHSYFMVNDLDIHH
jgi:molybdenum cofactor synthesis domain-containing protein